MVYLFCKKRATIGGEYGVSALYCGALFDYYKLEMYSVKRTLVYGVSFRHHLNPIKTWKTKTACGITPSAAQSTLNIMLYMVCDSIDDSAVLYDTSYFILCRVIASMMSLTLVRGRGCNVPYQVLRTIVQRTYGTHKNLHISLFLHTIFGPT